MSLLLLFLAACGSSSLKLGGEKPADRVDADGDGSRGADDCDDADATVYPGAQEVCDDQDNDCDSLIDGEDPDVLDASTWYPDADGDEHGTGSGIIACDRPEGYAQRDDDCDDGNASKHPGAEEVCDGVDNDCDGLSDGQDDGLSGGSTWYADGDGDGYGGAGETILACSAPSGYAATSTDCDDSDAAVNEAAYEVCDDVDNDCDGLIDGQDDDVIGESIWYADVDGDGYGDPDAPFVSCNHPGGHVDNDDDCDDTNASITTRC